MIPPDAFQVVEGPIVIALSGGPDSAAAAALAKEAGLAVRCIHVDHGLTGSARMREAAKSIAAMLGLDVDIVEIQPDSTSETALRRARYDALLGRLEPHEALITAHHADDRAETVLINLFRGAGPAGLAGIPSSRGPIMRPFLDFSAAELRRIATARRLPFVDDPENESTEHLRSRVRNELMPLIERDYQPAIRVTLGRTAENMAAAASVLREIGSRVPVERSAEGLRASMGRLMAADRITRRHVFRTMLTVSRPPLPPTEAEVTRVEQVYAGAGRTELESTEAQAFVSGPWLYVATEAEAPRPAPLRDGTVWGSYRFVFTEPGPVQLSKWRFVTTRTSLHLRPVEPDDVIAMREGSKAAAQAIRERGFQPEAHPVVVDDSGEVVWIPGVRHAWLPTPEAGGRESGYLEILANQDSPWEPFEP